MVLGDEKPYDLADLPACRRVACAVCRAEDCGQVVVQSRYDAGRPLSEEVADQGITAVRRH